MCLGNLLSSRGPVVKGTDLNPKNLGSTPIGTPMSHWWRQEGRPAKTAPMHQQKSYLSSHTRALSKGVNRANFRHW